MFTDHARTDPEKVLFFSQPRVSFGHLRGHVPSFQIECLVLGRSSWLLTTRFLGVRLKPFDPWMGSPSDHQRDRFLYSGQSTIRQSNMACCGLLENPPFGSIIFPASHCYINKLSFFTRLLQPGRLPEGKFHVASVCQVFCHP